MSGIGIVLMGAKGLWDISLDPVLTLFIQSRWELGFRKAHKDCVRGNIQKNITNPAVKSL